MTSINRFLDNILIDFDQYVMSCQDLCKLWDAHYDAGRIPNYSDVNIQQLYLLRYAYAYAFEYKYMYQLLLYSIPLPDEITVTSIGCGSMVDYWSLTRAVGDRCTIDYRGIDTIDWHYKFSARALDTVVYYRENALDYMQQNYAPSDIFIFPKSISEFSLREVEQLTKCISEKNMLKDRVHFLFSLRNDQGSMARDMQKTKALFNMLIDRGFQTRSKNNMYYQFGEDVQGKTIQSVDSDFNHPGKIIDYIKELYAACPKFDQCVKKEGCQKRLGRFPMLKCKYAAWQIFSFERA